MQRIIRIACLANLAWLLLTACASAATPLQFADWVYEPVQQVENGAYIGFQLKYAILLPTKDAPTYTFSVMSCTAVDDDASPATQQGADELAALRSLLATDPAALALCDQLEALLPVPPPNGRHAAASWVPGKNCIYPQVSGDLGLYDLTVQCVGPDGQIAKQTRRINLVPNKTRYTSILDFIQQTASVRTSLPAIKHVELVGHAYWVTTTKWPVTTSPPTPQRNWPTLANFATISNDVTTFPAPLLKSVGSIAIAKSSDNLYKSKPATNGGNLGALNYFALGMDDQGGKITAVQPILTKLWTDPVAPACSIGPFGADADKFPYDNPDAVPALDNCIPVLGNSGSENAYCDMMSICIGSYRPDVFAAKLKAGTLHGDSYAIVLRSIYEICGQVPLGLKRGQPIYKRYAPSGLGFQGKLYLRVMQNSFDQAM